MKVFCISIAVLMTLAVVVLIIVYFVKLKPDATNKIQEAQQKASDVENECAENTDVLEQEILNKNHELETEKANHMREVDTLNRRIDFLKTAITVAQTSIEVLTRSNAEKDSEIVRLQNEVISHLDEIRRLTEEVEILEAEISNLQRQLSDGITTDLCQQYVQLDDMCVASTTMSAFADYRCRIASLKSDGSWTWLRADNDNVARWAPSGSSFSDNDMWTVKHVESDIFEFNSLVNKELTLNGAHSGMHVTGTDTNLKRWHMEINSVYTTIRNAAGNIYITNSASGQTVGSEPETLYLLSYTLVPPVTQCDVEYNLE